MKRKIKHKISVKLESKEPLNYLFKSDATITQIAIVSDSEVEVINPIEHLGDVLVPKHKVNIINNVKTASYFPMRMSHDVQKNETITALFNTAVTVIINVVEYKER